MLDRLLSVIMPHYCISCGEFGDGLCDYCKYDIEPTPLERCIVCNSSLRQKVCSEACTLQGIPQYIVGRREDLLEKLMDAYKFQPARGFASTIASLLHQHTPQLPSNAVIVPIPTATSHVRQRGFDHTARLAYQFGRVRDARIHSPLKRRHNMRQIGASKSTRIKQAKTAFYCQNTLSDTTTYVLLDDVVTTGATITAARDQLKKAGAATFVIIAVCAQLDEPKSL